MIAVGLALVALVPVLVFTVLSRWGVLIAVILAMMIGLAVWVWQRGFVFVEIAAFLIHFDGVGLGPVRMGRFVAAMAILVLAYKLISGWRPLAIPVRHWAPVWIFAVWATASAMWSTETGAWVFAMGQFVLGLAFFCIAALLTESHRMLQQFLRAYWVGGLFGAAGGFLGIALGARRAVGFGADPNFFGLLLATMIPLTVYYRRHATTAVAKHVYTLTLGIVLAGAGAAGSRSGLIGGSVAIVGIMVTRPGLSALRRGGVAVGSVLLAGVAFVLGFVLNPANLERGFDDRGAGRLDLWNVAISLSKENPIVGYGFGQLKGLVPPNLLLTPGSVRLNELRPDVSAHNTWLDVQGDLGVVGLVLFSAIFVVAILGFLRPRWLQLRELQTMMLVMMLPVLTGSFFLPLINNKVAWMLLGSSAMLQVPSYRSRWSGLVASAERSTSRSTSTVAVDEPASTALAVPYTKGERSEVAGEEVWERVRLARFDLRINRRFRRLVLAGALITALACGVVAASRPTSYVATAGVLMPRIAGSVGSEQVRVDQQQIQGVLTLAISGAYAAELGELAALDRSVPEIRDGLFAGRPRMGNYLEITYTSPDQDEVRAVMPQMLAALDNVFLSSREFATAQTADELRPVVPGESRISTGPSFFRAYEETTLDVEPPRVGWVVFVGLLTGTLIVSGLLLAGQRRKRISNDDDFIENIRIPVWGRLRGAGRRSRRDGDQLRQIVAATYDYSPSDGELARFVVTSPRSGPEARRVALSLATELVAVGRRVALVDGRVNRPWLSVRLGGVGRPGVVDVADGSVELDTVIRRVNPLRLPRLFRREIGTRAEQLRFVPAGRWRRRASAGVPLVALEMIDPEVAIVVLAPAVLGEVTSSELVGWAESLVVAAKVGETTTADLEEAAAQLRLFSSAPTGLVLVDG